MKNISKEDFILWNIVKDEPSELYDTVYHYTTVVELINDNSLNISDCVELRCVAELSIFWQKVISAEIERSK